MYDFVLYPHCSCFVSCMDLCVCVSAWWTCMLSSRAIGLDIFGRQYPIELASAMGVRIVGSLHIKRYNRCVLVGNELHVGGVMGGCVCVYYQFMYPTACGRRAMEAAVLPFYMTIVPSPTGVAVLVGFPFLLPPSTAVWEGVLYAMEVPATEVCKGGMRWRYTLWYGRSNQRYRSHSFVCPQLTQILQVK